MTTASERIPLIGLSLADAYRLSEQLRTRSLLLRDAICALRAEGGDVDGLTTDRIEVLHLREKLTAAITATLGDLG